MINLKKSGIDHKVKMKKVKSTIWFHYLTQALKNKLCN